ncbi:MAG: hypothetical protein JST58_01795 [Bacteroidetes bacterium]|nr:hypothetical protein [Bacteroidota bacterium]
MKRNYLLLIATFFFSLYSMANTFRDSSLANLISKKQYEKFFPHHYRIYSYENLIAASKNFPLFANEGDLLTRKRELLAFLANIAHETSSGWNNAVGGPYAWGLVYNEEQACKDKSCPQYNIAGTSNYQPVPGKDYHGRGPMQLSYAYNYGLAGQELNLPLLQQPDLVSTDGVVAFKTAFWFWMREQKPKPSCHNVMCGNWQPTDDDKKLNRKPGFGMTINIINGRLECNKTTNTDFQEKRENRIGFYKWFAHIMKITVEDDCDCQDMGSYGN